MSAVPDKIIIRDLEVSCHIGVPDAERAQPQRLLVSLEMDGDFRPAAAADDLAKTVDYFAVCRRLVHFGDNRSWKLIETLATDIADMVHKEFKVRSLEVEIKKFVIPQTRFIAVKIRRSWRR